MNTFERAHPARSSARRHGRVWRVMALTLAGAALVAACGDDDSAGDTTAAPAEATSGPTEATPTTATATTPAKTDDGYGNTPGTAATTAADTAGSTAPGGTPAGGAAAVGAAETSLGTVLVDAEGFTLYGFLNDTDGESTCLDACADAWPPALVEGEPTVGDGVDESVIKTVEHPTGTMLAAGDWPLYRFAGDEAPGDVNGQGSGGVWFVVAPDGSLIEN